MLFFTWSRLTLYFSVLLCWISSSIGHVFIYTPSFLIIRLEFTKKYFVNVFTFENLLFSACFRSLWMAFVCSLLLSVKLQCLHFYDVSKKPSLLRFSVISLLDFFVYRSCIYIHSLSPHHPPRTYSKMLAILLLLSFSLDFVCFSFYRLALSL